MKNIIKFCKDILFPIFCVVCQREGSWWCAECRKKDISVSLVERCPVCGGESKNGSVCSGCTRGSTVHSIISLASYSEKTPLAKLITIFKYHHGHDIRQVWLGLLEDYTVKLSTIFLANSVIIPVPLFSLRERERGYNQAVYIAEAFGKALGRSVVSSSLKRIRPTKQQAKLARAERFENVAGAFIWDSKNNPPASIILVDDVFTTGATMQECARVLKDAGAGEVCGFTLARD